MPGTPHDLASEDALLADMLGFPDIIGDVAQVVAAGDFFQPRAAVAFAALLDAWRHGEPHDAASLSAHLHDVGQSPDPAWLQSLVQVPGSWRRHADSVIAHRVRRELAMAVSIAQAGFDRTADPYATLDELRAHLANIEIPDGSPPKDLHQLDEFIDRPENVSPPWVVPGLLRVGWRVLLVAAEGKGKSTLWRQFALCAAQGLHPLGFERMPRSRTLLIDLENPPDAIATGCVPIRTQVARKVDYEPGRAWLWHRPQGINLRSRGHVAELAAVLSACRPELVCLGPVYKSYTRGRDSDEEAVAEVQATLDDLRTRFGFALLLEHHAPQETGGFRTIRPYGTSLWLRWPEIGIAMEEERGEPGVKLNRFRGDRLKCTWPERLERGPVWPWSGVWNDSSWRSPA